MAFSEGQEYSSPSKRIKLDLSEHLSNSNVEIDFGPFSVPKKTVHDENTGNCSKSTDMLNNVACDLQQGIHSLNNSLDTEPGPSLPTSSTDGSFIVEESFSKDDDRDEVSSTVSNLSDLSGLSEISGQDWKPTAGPMCWVQKQMLLGSNPRSVLTKMLGEGGHIPADIDDLTLWKIIVNIMSEPPRRDKLTHVNTLTDVVNLVRTSKKIIVLTGAGVSVSCGIPDFRSRGGIYSRLALDFPDLPDPQSMFDIQYFRQDPRPFFKFAREIYPGQFTPSPCHRFIKNLEKHRKLLRNYSQNIDTLEQIAGIQNVIECHGSFATASCTNCKHQVSADDIRQDIFAQHIPLCPMCHDLDNDATSSMNSFDQTKEYYKVLVSRGVMKPDIVFFGENLPDMFHDSMASDKDEVDLMIVIGSTLKVRPVALIPSSIPSHVPQILINREPLAHHTFDVELLGDSDVIINQICHMLGEDWSHVCHLPSPLAEAASLLPSPVCDPRMDTASPPSQMSLLCSKERHMSIDSSTRDSGLCVDSPEMMADGDTAESNKSDTSKIQDAELTRPFEADISSSAKVTDSVVSNVNSVSESVGLGAEASTSEARDTLRMSVDSMEACSSRRRMSVDSAIDDSSVSSKKRRLSGGMKESLAVRLPENSFYLLGASRYIFPGAEVMCDANPRDVDNSSQSGSSDSEDSDSDSWSSPECP